MKSHAVIPGHLVFDRVFAGAEMTRVIGALAHADLTRTKAGARHVLSLPCVRALAHDERLLRIAAHFLGADAIAFGATLFDKSPGANWLVGWHQDTALPLKARVDGSEWGAWSTKGGVLYAHAPAWALEQVIALRVSLDDSTTTNGPLRVLPGTHTSGVLTVAEIRHAARDAAPVDCVTTAGGVVAMRPLIVHASSKSADDRPRRVLHIEYATSGLEQRIPLAVE